MINVSLTMETGSDSALFGGDLCFPPVQIAKLIVSGTPLQFRSKDLNVIHSLGEWFRLK